MTVCRRAVAMGLLGWVLAGTSASSLAAGCFGSRELAAPDGGRSVRVTRLGRGGCGESMLQILDQDGRLLVDADFTSPDGEHGAGVVDADWTADSQFLVLSLTAAASRLTPPVLIEVYRRSTNKLLSLDVLAGGHGPVVKDPGFSLGEGNVLVLKGAGGAAEEIPLARN